MTYQEILESALSGKVNFEQYLACRQMGCVKPELIVAAKLYPVLKTLDRKFRRSKKGFAAVAVEWVKL